MREGCKVSWTMRMGTPRIQGVGAVLLLECALMATGFAKAVALQASGGGVQFVAFANGLGKVKQGAA